MKTEEFQKELIELYRKHEKQGIFVVLDGNRFHFSHVGIGPGLAADITRSISKKFAEMLKDQKDTYGH